MNCFAGRAMTRKGSHLEAMDFAKGSTRRTTHGDRLPDGQISVPPCRSGVQSLSQKYFSCHVGQITLTTPPVSPGKGRIASRHELWVGMRWTRQRRARKGLQGGFAVSDCPARGRTMLPTVAARTPPGPRVPVERSAGTGADGEVVRT